MSTVKNVYGRNYDLDVPYNVAVSKRISDFDGLSRNIVNISITGFPFSRHRLIPCIYRYGRCIIIGS